jgi:hypothetical protein
MTDIYPFWQREFVSMALYKYGYKECNNFTPDHNKPTYYFYKPYDNNTRVKYRSINWKQAYDQYPEVKTLISKTELDKYKSDVIDISEKIDGADRFIDQSTQTYDSDLSEFETTYLLSITYDLILTDLEKHKKILDIYTALERRITEIETHIETLKNSIKILRDTDPNNTTICDTIASNIHKLYISIKEDKMRLNVLNKLLHRSPVA